MPSCSRTIPGYPAIETWTQAPKPRGQRQHQCLQEHPDAQAVHQAEVAVRRHHTAQWGAEELPVAQHRDAPRLGVVAGDAHRAVHARAKIAAQVGEFGGQLRHLGWFRAGLLQHGGDEPVAGSAGDEHDMPRPHVGVRRRARGQLERLLDQVMRHGVGQEHSRRVPPPDGVVEVVHVCGCLPAGPGTHSRRTMTVFPGRRPGRWPLSKASRPSPRGKVAAICTRSRPSSTSAASRVS